MKSSEVCQNIVMRASRGMPTVPLVRAPQEQLEAMLGGLTRPKILCGVMGYLSRPAISLDAR
jgi:hypothetical protein